MLAETITFGRVRNNKFEQRKIFCTKDDTWNRVPTWPVVYMKWCCSSMNLWFLYSTSKHQYFWPLTCSGRWEKPQHSSQECTVGDTLMLQVQPSHFMKAKGSASQAAFWILAVSEQRVMDELCARNGINTS